MASNGALRYVDPSVARGRIYRAYAAFSATAFGRWLSRHFLWKLDPLLMRLSGGRLRMSVGVPAALLETRGARTGRVRRNAVIYFHDGDRVTIIPSKAGAPENPAWYYNVRANPDITFGGQPFRAQIVDDEAERTRLWKLADNVFPPFETYRDMTARAGRTIPIVQLIPARAGGA
jgi:deazaflavin-dependent oxidoreductase (nitroreductase family)